jgi:hypothetical protein
MSKMTGVWVTGASNHWQQDIFCMPGGSWTTVTRYGRSIPFLAAAEYDEQKCWSFATADSMTLQVKAGTADVRHPLTGPRKPISSELNLQGYFRLQFSIFFYKAL